MGRPCWWLNTDGALAEPTPPRKRDEQACLLLDLVAQWGRKLVHVFDQGFAGALWLRLLLASQVRFVLRWRKDYQLLDADGNARLTWKLG